MLIVPHYDIPVFTNFPKQLSGQKDGLDISRHKERLKKYHQPLVLGQDSAGGSFPHSPCPLVQALRGRKGNSSSHYHPSDSWGKNFAFPLP